MIPPRSVLLSFIALAVLASVMFFWSLGTNPLEKWDEAIHAQVTHEMVESGNWLELTWNHEPYYWKPPLRFWLGGVATAVLGENEFSIRFWSALAGTLTTLLIGLWAWQMSKKHSTIWLTVMVFLSGKYLFGHAFRTGETDGLLTFFTVLSLWAYWKSWSKPRWLLLVAAALGLGFITKFTAIAFAGIPILLHLIFTRGFNTYSKKIWLQSISVGLIIIAPWIVSQLLLRGFTFIQTTISNDVVERSSTNLYGFSAGPGWYWKVFIQRFFPFAAFALPASVWAIGRALKKRDQLLTFFLIYLASGIILLSVNATKSSWYLLPLYPILALVMGMWLTRWFAWPLRWTTVALIGWGVVAFVRRLPSMVPDDGLTHWLVPQAYVAGLDGQSGRWLTALGIGLLTVALTIVAHYRKSRLLWRVIPMAVLLWVGTLALAGQRAELMLQRGEPLLPATRKILQAEQPETLYIQNIYVHHEPTIRYYLGNEPGTTLVHIEGLQPTSGLVLEKIQNGIVPFPGTLLLSSPDFQLVRIAP
ncbi:MAG: glycosyltransferase family 39 protein [Patescibacteria group bacterium]